MKLIESRQNPHFKQALKIAADRRSFPDLFLVEGEKLIREAIAAGLKPEQIFLTAKSSGNFSKFHAICTELSPGLFRELSTVVSPADALAIFRRPEHEPLHDLLGRARLILVLDRLQDPGNIGTTIRAAEAMGADTVVLLQGCCSFLNHKAVRAAMGSSFRLPVHENVDARQLLELLRAENFELIGTDMNGCSIHRFQFPGRSALILGQEGSGIAANLKKECSLLLAIPMQGQVESLNVATSAAICLYEWSKQHQA